MPSKSELRIYSCVWTLGLIVGIVSATGQETFPSGWEADSTLRDVHFIDLDFGWAVGDKGTILKTDDGGRQWSSISSPRDVIWHNVFFLDEMTGWIAGGHYRGPLERTVGILIKTEDGGKSWKNISQNGVSFIKQVRFQDPQNGWMFCDVNELYPTGLLRTSDGGNSWTTVTTTQGHQIKNVSPGKRIPRFAMTNTNELVATNSRIEITPIPIPLSNPLALITLPDGKLQISARGAIALYSPASGWEPCSINPNSSQTDFHAIASRDQNIWVTGSPGNYIHRSTDGGRNWSAFRTGQTEPLRSVFFLNSERGWAVGDLGKIVTTKDGGKTWSNQRNEDVRLGVLNLVSSTDSLSQDSNALLSGSFGHLSATSVFANAASKKTKSNLSNESLRIAQATGRCGVSAFSTTTQSEKRFLRQLVQELRTWCPPVVVINDKDSVLKRWINSAVDAAADPEKYPDLSESGLNPWAVQKVVSISTDNDTGQSVSIDQFSALLGRTVSLQSRFGKMVISGMKKEKHRGQIYWQTVYSKVPSRYSSQGITTGTMAYSDPNRNREKAEVQIKNMQQFRSISNWKPSLDKLVRMSILSPLDEKVWFESVTAASSGMDEVTYAFFLKDLSERYSMSGKPVMSDSTERLILQKVLSTEVGEQSLVKMIQRYGSDESNFQLSRLVSSRMAAEQNGKFIDPKVRSAGGESPFGSPSQASHSEPGSGDFNVAPASMTNATQLIEIFQNRYPEICIRKNVAFQLAKLKLKIGNRSAFDRILDSSSKSLQYSDDAVLISREKNLLKEDGIVLGSYAMGDATAERILLDSKFSENAWSSGDMKFAMDEEFLYLAFQKKMESGFDGPHRRKRDESLTKYDRVRVLIDFDRDYHSAIEFSVDVRGACNDLLWRDSKTRDFSYDPKWYVSSRHQNGWWRVEAAIPRSELPVDRITQHSAWIANSVFVKAGEPGEESLNELPRAKDKVLVFQSVSAKSVSE